MSKTHQLKIWPEYFNAILKKEKTFEIRKNDRNFQVGDILKLREYDPRTELYTGSWICVKVTYILTKQNPFIDLGEMVVMSIKY